MSFYITRINEFDFGLKFIINRSSRVSQAPIRNFYVNDEDWEDSQPLINESNKMIRNLLPIKYGDTVKD